jgi:nicotinate-nucleotide--dimethylbenzimidazole phosphoribosyltransferase
MAQTALKFDEIITLIQSMEHPSCSVRREISDMDKVERIKYWLNFAADRQIFEIKRPRLSLYAASHGFAASDDMQKAHFKNMVEQLLAGDHAINEVIDLASADLRLYDLNMDEPTDDLRIGDAMNDESLLNSLSYGLMTIEPESDLVSIATIGAGAEDLGRAFCASFIPALKSTLKVKLENVSLDTCFQALKANSGYELNAVIGSVIAARLAHVPIILEGYAGLAAGLFLNALNDNTHWHCAFALPQDDNEPALRAYLEAQNRLVLDDPRPYGLRQDSAINGGMQIGALRQMLILDNFYAQQKIAS